MSVRKLSGEFLNLLKRDSENQDQAWAPEEDYKKIIDSLSVVESLYPDQVLLLCNRSHPQAHYVSSNCTNILGFTSREFGALIPQDYFDRVHPQDAEGLKECFAFLNKSDLLNPLQYRFVMYYRFRDKHDNFLILRDEKLAIESNGKVIYFTLFKNLTGQEKFFNVKMDVLQKVDGKLNKVYTYSPKESSSLTPRQHEIIELITKGFSTQEIADALKVSLNTVKNHKQALFRKVNVKSSVELINYAATFNS